MKRLPASCHCPDPSCTAAEETEMEYARQTLRLVEERDEARAALRNFVREHLEEIHDVSYEYCRLCIEARRILGEVEP